MKTLAKILYTTAFTAVLLASAFTETFGSATLPVKVKKVTPFSFNRIQITGNVTVIISQGFRERVTADGDFNRSNVSVRKKGYTLLISSTATEPVTINVSVTDLQRIDASNNAVVRTAGKIQVTYLQVLLKDRAVAEIDADTESLYTHIRGNADLKLSGTTRDHIVSKDGISKLTLQNFVALKSTVETAASELLATAKAKGRI